VQRSCGRLRRAGDKWLHPIDTWRTKASRLMRSGKMALPSLRFRFRLRRSHNHSLVVFQRASTEILRARQRFLREFCLAEFPIG
jgi:hypothetical protein